MYQTICDEITDLKQVDLVRLVAVSKTRSADQVAALVNQGQRDFGENYLQEALKKQEQLNQLGFLNLIWHFIGQIQSNKIRLIVEHFDWVHSVGQTEHAERLSDQAETLGKTLNICVQVKLDPEPQKSGVLLSELSDFIEFIGVLPNLQCRGLMMLPKFRSQKSEQLRIFRELNTLFEKYKALGHDWDTLSIGTTNDFRAALIAGATCIRIGSGLFGEQNV